MQRERWREMRERWRDGGLTSAKISIFKWNKDIDIFSSLSTWWCWWWYGMVWSWENREKVGGEKKGDVYIKLVDNTSFLSVCLVLLEWLVSWLETLSHIFQHFHQLSKHENKKKRGCEYFCFSGFGESLLGQLRRNLSNPIQEGNNVSIDLTFFGSLNLNYVVKVFIHRKNSIENILTFFLSIGLAWHHLSFGMEGGY